eukprot:1181659-Prorocentrum_minimum.AAC.2
MWLNRSPASPPKPRSDGTPPPTGRHQSDVKHPQQQQLVTECFRGRALSPILEWSRLGRVRVGEIQIAVRGRMLPGKQGSNKTVLKKGPPKRGGACHGNWRVVKGG